MTNNKTLKIPISTLVNEQINLYYDTPEKIKELKTALILTVLNMCVSANNMVQVHQVPCEIDVAENLTRKIQNIQLSLSEFNLDNYIQYTKEEPNWIPKELKTEEKIHYIELKIRGPTYNGLKLSCKLFRARMDKYIESLEMSAEEKEKLNDDQKKKFEEAKKLKLKRAPNYNCFEEFIYGNLVDKISHNLLTQMEKQILEDFNKDYPEGPEAKLPSSIPPPQPMPLPPTKSL